MDNKHIAIMQIESGEEIAGYWLTKNISGTGIYKLLMKKCIDGTFAWAHFIQRENGTKENIYRGEITKDEIPKLLASINSNLRKTFGEDYILKQGSADVLSLPNQKWDDKILN